MRFTFLMSVFFLLSVSVFGQAKGAKRVAIYIYGNANSKVLAGVKDYVEKFVSGTNGYILCNRDVTSIMQEMKFSDSGFTNDKDRVKFGEMYTVGYLLDFRVTGDRPYDHPYDVRIKGSLLDIGSGVVLESDLAELTSKSRLESKCKELVEHILGTTSSVGSSRNNPFALITPYKAAGRYDWGISVGYVSKKMKYKDKDGYTNDYGLLKDKSMSGVQVGIHYDGFLFPNHFGLGIGTGAYYEYYWQKGDTQLDSEYGNYRASYSEHNVYVPLDLIFRIYFSKSERCQVNLTLYGGIGGNYGFRNKCVWKSVPGDREIRKETNLYDYDEWGIKHFYMNIEYGASLRIGRLSFNAKLFSPLTDWSGDKFYSQKPVKDMNVGISCMF